MIEVSELPARGSQAHRALVQRDTISDAVLGAAAELLREVRVSGDVAVREMTRRFDGVDVPNSLVDPISLQLALSEAPPKLVAAMRGAADHITRVHSAQRFSEQPVSVAEGVRVWRVWRPFDRVGIYVPGGRAPYPSSVLMMGVPARLAGCREIVLCSPPGRSGQIDSTILAAAALAGVTEVHAIGGVQAIGAMAYGTNAVGRVDKVFGPGNAYVTAAKRLVFGEVAVDMPAGPSEVVVLTDGSVPAAWLAADLAAQTEHAPDSVAVLVSTEPELATAVDFQLVAGTAGQVQVFTARSFDEAIAFANDYAPEHLILACHEPERWLDRVTHAGSVFLGPYAPAAIGDYATGANHVIPTGGMARSFSALGLDAFGHTLQVQSLSSDGLAGLASIAREIAAVEGFEHHWQSIAVRSQHAAAPGDRTGDPGRDG